MRFVHIADIHMDSPFSFLDSKAGLGDIRRIEQRQALKNVINYVIENNIEYLFISGDLYEQEYIKESTIKYIDEQFRRSPNTKIFISPGNHDPYLNKSYYNTYKWSDNVHIFKRRF